MKAFLQLLLLTFVPIHFSFTFDLYEYNKGLSTTMLGPFELSWGTNDAYLHIVHEAEPDRWLFRTLPSTPFVTIGFATDSKPPIVDGNFKVNEWTLFETPYQNIQKVTTSSDKVVICGEVWGLVTRASYEMVIGYTRGSNQLSFNITAAAIQGTFNRLFLNYWADPKENFYGFGVQYTHWNLKGHRVPILVAEQGIGRGAQPTTSVLNFIADGTGGDPLTTYAPKALYMTNFNRSMLFDNSQIMFFDLRATDSVVVELWGTSLAGRIIYGSSMLDLVTEVTLITGRMHSLPDWTQHGAIVGLEGGTAEVVEHVDSLLTHGVPISGVWLQDWVGLRHAYDGDRLLWNWRLDPEYYPNWDRTVSKWAELNIRVLTYINPFFSELDSNDLVHRQSSVSGSSSNPVVPLRNLYREGLNNKYFVQNKHGEAYKLRSGSIEFCMLDTSNPAARRWMKDILKYEMIQNSSSSGWMADFGEYLPFDAVLYNGISGADYHNKYPEEWAKVNEEALEEARIEGVSQKVAYPSSKRCSSPKENVRSDVIYFMRSAWMQSPGHTSLFWLGDQMVSWDKYDGIKTVVVGALSGGLGGHSLTHSDIGGYTMQELGPFPNVRTRELLYRWIELEAFGSAVFRSHIGSLVSPNNVQIYQDSESMQFLSRFALIFCQLADYRKELMLEAESKGWPMIRSMAAHYAYDEISWDLKAQYMFGPDFLIAPVLDSYRSSYVQSSGQASQRPSLKFSTENVPVRGLKVYIPAHSSWIHLWSGQRVDGGSSGRFVAVDSPFGHPPVFFNPRSKHGKALRKYICKNNFDAEYKVAEPSVDLCENVSTGFPCDTSNHPSFVFKTSVSESETVDISESIFGTAEAIINVDKRNDRARIGKISDYKEVTWLDWLGLSDYSSSWDNYPHNMAHLHSISSTSDSNQLQASIAVASIDSQ